MESFEGFHVLGATIYARPIAITSNRFIAGFAIHGGEGASGPVFYSAQLAENDFPSAAEAKQHALSVATDWIRHNQHIVEKFRAFNPIHHRHGVVIGAVADQKENGLWRGTAIVTQANVEPQYHPNMAEFSTKEEAEHQAIAAAKALWDSTHD